MLHQQKKQEKRNAGNFTHDNGKILITTHTGQSRCLYEDISSISWKAVSALKPNWQITILGYLLIAIIFILPEGTESIKIIAFMAGFFLVIYAMVGFRDKWEDVIIETRGGLLISYSVEIGLAEAEVEKVEREKRNIIAKMKYEALPHLEERS